MAIKDDVRHERHDGKPLGSALPSGLVGPLSLLRTDLDRFTSSADIASSAVHVLSFIASASGDALLPEERIIAPAGGVPSTALGRRTGGSSAS